MKEITAGLGHYQRVTEGLRIFDRYMPENEAAFPQITAHHDVILAGPDPETVSAEDAATLEGLGWHPGDEECFEFFT